MNAPFDDHKHAISKEAGTLQGQTDEARAGERLADLIRYYQSHNSTDWPDKNEVLVEIADLAKQGIYRDDISAPLEIRRLQSAIVEGTWATLALQMIGEIEAGDLYDKIHTRHSMRPSPVVIPGNCERLVTAETQEPLR